MDGSAAMMEEVDRFCTRVLGEGPAAGIAASAARAAGAGDRVALLRAAVAACPEAPLEPEHPRGTPAGAPGTDLVAAVAGELAAATARLPLRQRQALALRELLGLGHADIAAVLGIAAADVGPVLAHARLGLRAKLRGDSAGGGPGAGGCIETERALRTIAARQDSEPVAAADDEWLIEHLGHCRECAAAHAAMLEASACYRAWRPAGERGAGGPASAPATAGAGAGAGAAGA